jgi:glycosyltransferase involved in cell wall biosynthesis
MKINSINPLVSIIIPSFNQGEFIEQTILSVLNQTYQNIECIIIDGSSSDNTVDVIKRYESMLSKIVSEEDDGQADAINKGIRLASGDFITWINSDDLLDPAAIEYAVAAFAENPDVDFVYGDINLINERSVSLRVLKGCQVKIPCVFFTLDLPIPQQGSIWRRNVTNSVGLLGVQWHYVLDREFFLRICLKHNVKYINKRMGSFRQHGQSKSVKMKEGWIVELLSMYEALVNNPDWSFHNVNHLSKKVLASAHIHAAYLALWAGKYSVGVKNIVLAFSIYPTIFFNSHIYSKPIEKLKTFIYRKMDHDQ